MKTRKLPQKQIVLEVNGNLQEFIWTTIASRVKGFIKTSTENLLREELSHEIGAGRYESTKDR